MTSETQPPNLVLAVGAVVLRDDGRVLLVRRAKAPLAGEWTLVGGHVERNESIARAAEREVREETGLDVVAERFLEKVELPDARGGGFAIHEWLCLPRHGVDADAIVAGDDAAEVRWSSTCAEDLAALGVQNRTIEVIVRALSCRVPC